MESLIPLVENHQFKIELAIFKPMDVALVHGTQGCIAWVSTEVTSAVLNQF